MQKSWNSCKCENLVSDTQVPINTCLFLSPQVHPTDGSAAEWKHLQEKKPKNPIFQSPTHWWICSALGNWDYSLVAGIKVDKHFSKATIICARKQRYKMNKLSKPNLRPCCMFRTCFPVCALFLVNHPAVFSSST